MAYQIFVGMLADVKKWAEEMTCHLEWLHPTRRWLLSHLCRVLHEIDADPVVRIFALPLRTFEEAASDIVMSFVLR